MEIAIIPRHFLLYYSKNYSRQYDLNVLLSNILIITLFFIFNNELIKLFAHLPHICLINDISGVECPVCGTTRALCEISKSNLINAFYLNPVSIVIASFFIFQIPLRLISSSKIVTKYHLNFLINILRNSPII